MQGILESHRCIQIGRLLESRWFKDADQDFIDVCDLANLDPDIIRRFGMKVSRGDAHAKRRLLEFKHYFKKPTGRYNKNGRADNTNFNSD